jgi:hypothetical protein
MFFKSIINLFFNNSPKTKELFFDVSIEEVKEKLLKVAKRGF